MSFDDMSALINYVGPKSTSPIDGMEEWLAGCRSGWHSPRRLRGKSSR
jgi:hypothetical protein